MKIVDAAKKYVELRVELKRLQSRRAELRVQLHTTLGEEIRKQAPNINADQYQLVYNEALSLISERHKELGQLLAEVENESPSNRLMVRWAELLIFKDEPKDRPTEPPKIAEALVGLFACKRYKDSVLDDMEELFEQDLGNGMNLNRAQRRYWIRAIKSAGPQFLAFTKRAGYGLGMAAITHIFDKITR